MNQIVKAEPAQVPLRYEDIERLAASIAKSGLFGMKTTDQALALMMIASAEGLHPALAARDYDIIQGRPAKKAEAMQRDFLMAGGKIEWHALSDAIADATFSHPQGGTVRISWDIQRAAAAGLASKDNYKKFPRQMLRSRTVSEGVRTVWPLATSGMYVPEEAGDIRPQFNGTTIDAESETARTRSANAEDGDRLEEAERKRAAATSTPRAPRVTEPRRALPATPVDPLDGPLGYEWLVALKKKLAGAADLAEVEAIGGHTRVNDALADQATPPKVKQQITELLADAYAKHAEHREDGSGALSAADPDAADEPELPPVDIAGSRYASA